MMEFQALNKTCSMVYMSDISPVFEGHLNRNLVILKLKHWCIEKGKHFTNIKAIQYNSNVKDSECENSFSKNGWRYYGTYKGHNQVYIYIMNPQEVIKPSLLTRLKNGFEEFKKGFNKL